MTHLHMPAMLGFAGYSGSGKTTLLEQVIPRLKAHGLRLGIIKHSHHSIDPDKPGKDSYRLRHAGCAQTLLATKERHMLYFEYDHVERQEPTLDECLEQLKLNELDLVLVEGFRDQPFSKIEVFRPSYGKPLLFPNDPHIIAIATDGELNQEHSLPQLDLNQPEAITRYILDWMDNQ
ncbi:molybdopterin-guanine dinucleotide biosynthesis protein B [Photobacterium aquae]|uniref:Molybdopterin-guanine dinucleotide biosynthesis protein B n=1 Tax=Photobacterium aquae TaxID=1195763 RepID=A0A0J1HB92_9GAMM|nr:molybdopterin-guanine dinucleotide biosynthesis protein B [Photobacterium aquae]KLV08911.1 molybdopterin-guanine dinucleotide biosynthesis protein B [Photobacterium aquae]